jgi:hypothetical protein
MLTQKRESRASYGIEIVSNMNRSTMYDFFLSAALRLT